jgi:putative endopeptidase
LSASACGSHAPPAPQPQPRPPSTTTAPSPPAAPAPPPPPVEGIYAADLDRGADPCTDFYAFSNGAWRAANPIPPSMMRWSRRWQAGEAAKERLKDILDEVSARRDWPAAGVEQLIGDFYGACMDEASADRRGAAPIRPLLAEIAAIRDRAGVQRQIARLHDLGIGAPFGVVADSDLHTPADVIAWVRAGGLGLPDRDYYVKPEPRFAEARKRYLPHVEHLLALAGDPAAASSARAVVALETQLARASLDNVALRDPKAIDHRMTLAELQQLTPSFDWAAYLKGAAIAAAPFNVTQPAFLREVERRLAAAPIAGWRAYLSWHLVRSAAPLLSRPFVDADFAFDAALSGAQEQKPRWKRCVEATDELLGEALGKKYVERYFPPAAKARMKALVDNLLAAMRETIDRLDWMSPATKQRALEKLATFNPKIGYPDRWKDYSRVPIRRDSLWDDVVASRRWNVEDDRAQIGKPVDRGRWGLTPPTSDAYYNSSLNEMVFPAGILQPPAFRLEASDAVNYGAIGVVIGHEISHGFDDQGAQFDAQGRLSNWWTPDDLTKFRARSACVVDQFERYFIEPGIHHNGKLVLGESIGDSGGANLAYRALQRAQRAAPGPTIGGFTPEQQFFIAWGQFRADAIRPETQRLMIQGDPHPIAKYRVIGPLSNMPEFARAFSCKPDAPMVRPAAQRCEVW